MNERINTMQTYQVVNILHQYKVLEDQDAEGVWSFVNLPGISVRVDSFESLKANIISFFFEKEEIDITVKLPFSLKESEVKRKIRKALSFIQSHAEELL
jgi:hypothetical protein